MPRGSRQAIGANLPPTQEQYFDQTTPDFKVVSKPLDAPIDVSSLYTVQKQQNDKVSFWENMTTAINTVAPLVEKIKAENQRADQIKGWLKAATGEALDENASEAMVESYYKYQANMDYSLYNAALQTYYQENKAKWESPEDVNKALDEFNRQWLENRPSNDYYLETFLPTALERQQALVNNWTTEKTKEVAQEMYQTGVAGIQYQADQALEAGLAQFVGLDNLEALDSKEFIVNGFNSVDLNNFLRWNLSQIQEQAKDMGFNRIEASEIFVKRIGELAAKYGLPELLDFTTLADSSGISLDQTVLSDTINKYKEQATNVRNSKLDYYATLETEQQKKALDYYYKTNYFKISQLAEKAKYNPSEARSQMEALRKSMLEDEKYWSLDSSKFKELTNLANDIIFNPNKFSSVSSDEFVKDIDLSFYKGTLTEDVLLKGLYDGQLSLNDFIAYNGKLQAKNQATLEKDSQLLNSKTLAKAQVYGLTEDAWKAALDSPTASPKFIEQMTATYLQQTKASATLQADSDKASLAKKQKENYNNLKTQILEGHIPELESLDAMAASGELDAADADKLKNLIQSARDEWEDNYGKIFNTLKTKAIQKYAGNPMSTSWNKDIEYEMWRKAYELEEKFFQKYGYDNDNLRELYEQEVLQPLSEYGEQFSLETTDSALNVNPLDLAKEKKENIFTKVWNSFTKKDKNTQAATPEIKETEALYNNIVDNPFSYDKNTAVEKLQLKGFEPDVALKITKDATVAYVSSQLSIAENPQEAMIKLVVYLMAQGYSENEANDIIRQALMNK